MYRRGAEKVGGKKTEPVTFLLVLSVSVEIKIHLCPYLTF